MVPGVRRSNPRVSPDDERRERLRRAVLSVARTREHLGARLAGRDVGDGWAARARAAEDYAALLLRERDDARAALVREQAHTDDLALLLAEVHRLAPHAVATAIANREGPCR